MKARKLSIQTGDYVALFENVRACFFFHTLCRCRAVVLSSLGGTTGFLQNCPEAAATPLKSVKDATFHTDTRAARWHAALSRNPDSSGPIVDLVSAVAENSVAVGHVTHDSDFLTSITA